MAFIPRVPKTGTSSGRLGQSQKRGKITVRFDAAPLVNLVNVINGNFQSGGFNKALSRANEKAAIAVQNAMAESVTENVRGRGRPQRPGQRLAMSLADERNREVFANTFSVGLVTKWLNKSPAKLYYRQIEEGMGSFSGRILFTNNGGVGPHAYGPPFVAPRRGGALNLRMPQFHSGKRGVAVQEIGPYPAFHYQAAGRRAFFEYPIKDEYVRELLAAGIPVSKDTFKSRK